MHNEVSIYDRALLDTEIQSIFLADSNGKLRVCGVDLGTPDTYDFGTVAPFTTSGIESIQIENAGGSVLSIVDVYGDDWKEGATTHILVGDTEVDGGTGFFSLDYSSNPQFLMNLTPSNPTNVDSRVTANLINLPAGGTFTTVYTFEVSACG